MLGPKALTNPWLAGAEIALPFISGGLSGGEQAAQAKADREERRREFLAQLALQNRQLDSSNAVNATHTAGAQAGIPLMDQAFSGLQARFALGPSTFGNAGNQNRTMQQVASAYRPGQNPSVNALNDVYTQAMSRFGINPRTYQG